MSADVETLASPAPQPGDEAAPPGGASPPPPPAAADPAPAAPSEPAATGAGRTEPPDHDKLLALLDDVFKDDAAEGLDDATLVASIGRQEIDALPPRARAVVRALAAAATQRGAQQDAKLTSERAAFESERTAERQRLDAGVAELRRREAALYRTVDLGKLRDAAEAAPPQVDVTTPEGLAALARYHGEKAAAEGALKIHGPLAEEKAAAETAAAYDRLKDTYPELRNPAVEQEFTDFLLVENKGVDRAKGEPWRTNAVLGARLFFAERRAHEAARAAEQRARADATDRNASAAAINRATTGGAAPASLTIPDEVWQGGNVVDYLSKLTPEQRATIKQNLRRHGG